MKSKRLISLVLSMGILPSSILFSGVPLFAAPPLQLCDLTDFAEKDEESGLRLCLSKDLSKYEEPIDKEFLDHMVDTMNEITFVNDGIAESVEDAGYIGNVLLANSNLAKCLYLHSSYKANRDLNAFYRMSSGYISYSLYDILFTIYWRVIRLNSYPLYKKSQDRKEIPIGGPFYTTLYPTVLEDMLLHLDASVTQSTDMVESLNYNFLLAKALINKKCIPLKGFLTKLENFIKESYGKIEFEETNNIFDQIVIDSLVELKQEKNGDVVIVPHGMENKKRFFTYLKARKLGVLIVAIDKLSIRGCLMRCPQQVSSFRTNEEIALLRREERKRREEIKQAEEKKNKELEEKKQKQFEENEKIFREIKLKFSLKKQELRKQREAEKAMEESKHEKSDEKLKKENEEIQNEQFRCFCESECVRSSKRKSKSKKSSKSKKYSKKIDVSKSSSSSKSNSLPESTSSSALSENSDDDLKNIFETEGNNKVEMKIDGGKYELFYEPSLFSNIKEKNDASTVENVEKSVMDFILSLHVGGLDYAIKKFGRKKIINMSGCSQAKADLYKKYASKLGEIFKADSEKGSGPVLYKFKPNSTKECRIAYFVDDKNKVIYVTDNVDHIDKGKK